MSFSERPRFDKGSRERNINRTGGDSDEFSWNWNWPKLSTPGNIEDLAEDTTREVLEINRFMQSGFHFTLQNVFSPDFITFHMIHVGKEDPSQGDDEFERASYTFGGVCNFGNISTNGRISDSGLSMCSVEYSSKFVDASFQGQFLDADRSAFEIALGGSFDNSKLQAKIGQVTGVNFCTPLTKNFDAATELYLMMQGDLYTKYCLKYKNHRTVEDAQGEHTYKGNTMATVILGPTTEVDLNYTKEIMKNFKLVTGLSLTHEENNWDSTWKIGYNYKGDQQSGMGNMRVLLDPSGVSAMLSEVAVSETAMLSVSSKLNYSCNIYDFGIQLMAQM
eukprot:TRINITY_DN4649_c0_g2_i1.p1 TRINITY_DN4649_c0_g2~~TRINITY_DN4649_c0_g2_i1.p1  ORF type:complete len:334 (+),score=74.84 TRINITY_DN4649_c0_g2_i1:116-1117(+)